ncbi:MULTISPECIES: hypothetical protein [unclassified Imperialibacter]|uniref:hypothetical protein n=1 Tax=unclassified Imperialibacter TaxID=2629706 RepID=UPI00125B480E|nr:MULTISPECIES: hypothetical protein [unclassified Imperialibacter]CAD5299306.1 conserved hypothetical protein [Imperialibacter sp. 89]CAD5299893.1 conserved hypothetical protein [Imperialibacter sp. 75]VVT15720.1 conserved hypothetical protein [Imperialibacter sp. EC-SDR9]
MQVKYSKHFLNKLEDIFAESDYILRYEKGSFHSGYCILRDTKIAIVSKYFPLDGKINALLEILKSIEIDPKGLSDKNRSLLLELTQTKLEI